MARLLRPKKMKGSYMTGQTLYAPLNVDIDRQTGKPFIPEDNAMVVEEHQVET
jgi:hypothetical protein